MAEVLKNDWFEIDDVSVSWNSFGAFLCSF